MKIGVTLFIIAVAIIAIWIIVEIKRFRHKLFAILLIGLILFFYLSFTYVIKDKGVDIKTIPGVVTAGKIYFSWLGHIFGNVKTITVNSIKMDWTYNKTNSEWSPNNGK